MNGSLIGGFGVSFLTGAWIATVEDALPPAVLALLILLALACCVIGMLVSED